MSKYLEATPKYTGVTLEQRLKPLVLYKDEYDKQQDAYDKLLEDTLVLENIKDSEVDADLYRNYSDWREKLNTSADSLASTGILDMQSLRDLRREYINTYKPMEDKYKHRANLIFKQASEAGPDVIYKRDFSRVPLEEIELSDAIESQNLSEIYTSYTKRWSADFFASGVPEGNDAEEITVDNAIEEMGLSGYSDTDIERIRETLHDAYNAGITGATNLELDRSINEERLKEARNPSSTDLTSSPTTSTYTDSATGESYTVIKKNGKYYAPDGVTEIPEIDLRSYYSKYFTDPVVNAKYSFEGTKTVRYNPLDESVTSVPSAVGDTKTVATINKWYGNNNSCTSTSPAYVTIADAAAKKLGFDLKGLFAHGYTVTVKETGTGKTTAYFIEINKI